MFFFEEGGGEKEWGKGEEVERKGESVWIRGRGRGKR